MKPLGAAVAVIVAATIAAACNGDGPSLAPPTAGQTTTTASGPDTTEVAATTTTEIPLRTMTIAASGDILLHNLVIQKGKANSGGAGYDFRPMFDDVRGVLSCLRCLEFV